MSPGYLVDPHEIHPIIKNVEKIILKSMLIWISKLKKYCWNRKSLQSLPILI